MEGRILLGISTALVLNACSAPPPDKTEVVNLFENALSFEEGFSLRNKAAKVLKHINRSKVICSAETGDSEVAAAITELNEKIHEFMETSLKIHEKSQSSGDRISTPKVAYAREALTYAGLRATCKDGDVTFYKM